MTTESPKRRGRVKREITPSPFAIKQEEIYNITEAATYSGLNAHMFRQLLDSGKGPECITTVGSTGRKLYRFRKSSLDSWLRSQTFVSSAAAPPQGEVTGSVSEPAEASVPVPEAPVTFAAVGQELLSSTVLPTSDNIFSP